MKALAVLVAIAGVAAPKLVNRDDGLLDGKRFATRGKSTRIFVKENGRWLCIHGHDALAP